MGVSRLGEATGSLPVELKADVQRFFVEHPVDEAKRALSYSTPSLARVVEAGLLAPKGWMISQHHVKEEVQAPAGCLRARREKYGDSYVDFFRWETGPAQP